MGWIYGSTAEDALTGLNIHTRGWRSEVCSPIPMAFMGCSPQDNIVSMTQQKRWASGLFDIFLSKHSPILGTLYGKLQFRECLGYLWILTWALRSVPEICYAALPAYCIITNSTFLPKVRTKHLHHSLIVLDYTIAYHMSHFSVILFHTNNDAIVIKLNCNSLIIIYTNVYHMSPMLITPSGFEYKQKFIF